MFIRRILEHPIKHRQRPATRKRGILLEKLLHLHRTPISTLVCQGARRIPWRRSQNLTSAPCGICRNRGGERETYKVAGRHRLCLGRSRHRGWKTTDRWKRCGIGDDVKCSVNGASVSTKFGGLERVENRTSNGAVRNSAAPWLLGAVKMKVRWITNLLQVTTNPSTIKTQKG